MGVTEEEEDDQMEMTEEGQAVDPTVDQAVDQVVGQTADQVVADQVADQAMDQETDQVADCQQSHPHFPQVRRSLQDLPYLQEVRQGCQTNPLSSKRRSNGSLCCHGMETVTQRSSGSRKLTILHDSVQEP
jgi:hypothetical protein